MNTESKEITPAESVSVTAEAGGDAAEKEVTAEESRTAVGGSSADGADGQAGGAADEPDAAEGGELKTAAPKRKRGWIWNIVLIDILHNTSNYCMFSIVFS